MNKEELIEFLKENLKIEVDDTYPYYGSNVKNIEIKLILGNDVISSNSFCITEGRFLYNRGRKLT